MFEELVNLNVKIDGDNVTLSKTEMETAIKILTDKGAREWWNTPIGIAKFLQEDILDNAVNQDRIKDVPYDGSFNEASLPYLGW